MRVRTVTFSLIKVDFLTTWVLLRLMTLSLAISSGKYSVEKLEAIYDAFYE